MHSDDFMSELKFNTVKSTWTRAGITDLMAKKKKMTVPKDSYSFDSSIGNLADIEFI